MKSPTFDAAQAFVDHLMKCRACVDARSERAQCPDGAALMGACMTATLGAPEWFAEHGPFFCGFCLRWLKRDTCTECEWQWRDLMTEGEARAYRAGWESESDDDLREASAVAALEAFRAERKGKN